MITISWEVRSLDAKWKNSLKPIAWIPYNDSDKLPSVSVYHTMWLWHWEQTSDSGIKDDLQKTISSNLATWNLKRMHPYWLLLSPNNKETACLQHNNQSHLQVRCQNYHDGPCQVRLTWQIHDYLSFYLSFLQSKHSVVHPDPGPAALGLRAPASSCEEAVELLGRRGRSSTSTPVFPRRQWQSWITLINVSSTEDSCSSSQEPQHLMGQEFVRKQIRIGILSVN